MDNKKKKIVLTGGGTGGHIMPHLAIIPYLEKTFNFVYIGSKNSMEKKVMSGKMPFYEITTVKLKRKLDLSNLLIPFKLIKGVIDAKKVLKREKPDIVFSKGGFVSVPVVIASNMLKIPVISHESDLTLGLSNKLTKNKCKYVCTSFESTAKIIKNGIYTGSPVREEIFNGNKNNLSKYCTNPNLPNLVVIGGSLGSRTINNAVFENLNDICSLYNVFHIVGNGNKNTIISSPNYHQFEWVKNVEDFYCLADIVLTRGGSNVLFELLALKKPMLIIPLSKKESRGDQLLNAEYFKKKGWANVLLEENIEGSNLLESINATYLNKDVLAINMENGYKNGAREIAKIINKELSIN